MKYVVIILALSLGCNGYLLGRHAASAPVQAQSASTQQLTPTLRAYDGSRYSDLIHSLGNVNSAYQKQIQSYCTAINDPAVSIPATKFDGQQNLCRAAEPGFPTIQQEYETLEQDLRNKRL